MQGKSKELKQLFITAATKSFEKNQDEQAAVFAGLQAVSIKERKPAVAKAKAPAVPMHLKAVLDSIKPSVNEFSKTSSIQQAFLPKNSLQVGIDRSLISADFDNNGKLILTFDTGEVITTNEIAIKEYIEQNIAIAPNTQILSSDGSIIVNQENQVFDLGTAAVINPLDHLDFNQLTTSVGAVARLKWNDTDGTLEFGLKGGNVTLQIGQEQVVHILNNTAAAFVDMQVIRITGASGQRMTGALAQANAESTSATTFAVITEPIAKNQIGFATTSGLVRDVNTSAFNEGDALYLSPTVAGGITNVKPIAPNHMVLIGWCVRSNQNNGAIYVHVQNGYELDELHNVKINGVVNGQVLSYDSTLGLWKNSNAGSGSVTSVALTVPTGLAVTGTPITTSGTFQITYASGYSLPTTISQNNWDTAYNQRLQWDGGSTNLVASTARISLGLGTAATKDVGSANGVASLDSSGLIPSSQLPAIAITDTFVVNSQTEMLALIAEVGDIAVRLDLSKSLILKTSPASVLSNWQELLTPTDTVTSVAGRTGAVTLYSTDIGGLGTAATTDSTAYATSAQGSKADTAYGWGNHAIAGYLTSYTETDPIFEASPASDITTTDITNWNTATKTVTYFNKINTVANVTYTIQHNLGLVDKDAFTVNLMLNSEAILPAVTSVDVNSLTIKTSINTTNLSIMLVGLRA